ncbi:MAG TPA: CHAD domain-containing protein [Solirubrobacterales bacterium]|jgi:CHAD domain-containing protein
MSAFRLKARESEAAGIRRVAHERIEDAVGRLRDRSADPAKAVHEARKDVKKLRSTLRLVRPVIGDSVYRRENERFRDAARALSDARDTQVRAQTTEALGERFADDPPPGGWAALRAAVAGGEQTASGELGRLREQAAAEIERGDEEVERWPLGDDGFELLRPGLDRAYARGRKSFRAARAEPTDEALHEFRKRSKDLWYHLRLLRTGWPQVLEATAEQAHRLTDRLGDDHDLAVLGADLERGFESLTAGQRQHLRGLLERRRRELQGQAFGYAERLFAEKPKQFVRRIEAYWEAEKLLNAV